jgi:hypothetical protein
MTALWWLRWAVVAIAVVIGVVLISRHAVLIGGLILLLAFVRGVLLVAIRRRRAAWRQWRRRFGPPR